MPKILDACCGSRMFWFNRNNPDVIFADNRKLETTLCDGRALVIDPDVIIDFRNMPFDDNTFDLVVFDPPHLIRAGEKSWLAKKYGGKCTWDELGLPVTETGLALPCGATGRWTSEN